MLPAVVPHIPFADPISVLDASGHIGLPTVLFSRIIGPRRSEIVTLNQRAETREVIEDNLQYLDSDNMDQRETWNPSGMVSLMHAALVDTETSRRHEGGLIGGVLSALRGGWEEDVAADVTDPMFVGDEAAQKISLPELAVRS